MFPASWCLSKINVNVPSPFLKEHYSFFQAQLKCLLFCETYLTFLQLNNFLLLLTIPATQLVIAICSVWQSCVRVFLPPSAHWRAPGKQKLIILFWVPLYTAQHTGILETVVEYKWAELIMNHYWAVNTASPFSCFDSMIKHRNLMSTVDMIKHIDSSPIFYGEIILSPPYLMKNIQLLEASFSSMSRDAIR